MGGGLLIGGIYGFVGRRSPSGAVLPAQTAEESMPMPMRTPTPTASAAVPAGKSA